MRVRDGYSGREKRRENRGRFSVRKTACQSRSVLAQPERVGVEITDGCLPLANAPLQQTLQRACCVLVCPVLQTSSEEANVGAFTIAPYSSLPYRARRRHSPSYPLALTPECDTAFFFAVYRYLGLSHLCAIVVIVCTCLPCLAASLPS